MKNDKQRYAGRGVSPSKEDVHKAVKNLDKGIYPGAFCKILPDHFAGSNEHCSMIHADGAGTKSSLAYMYWKETGDIDVWKGIAVDALVMNLDDMMCAGAVGPFLVSSLIARNKFRIPGEIVEAIITATADFCEMMKELGVPMESGGGETADVGDVVSTLSVDSVMCCRMKRSEVVLASGMQAGDVIVSLSSYGQAAYEKEYNSGIGSNGLTAARHELLHHSYAEKYPESYDAQMPEELVYSGSLMLTDACPGTPLNAGKALLSPTRTYAPLLTTLFRKFRPAIHSMIHCTGGGQTKVLHFAGNVRIIKNNLLPVAPVFELIRKQSGFPASEMYRVFNMGQRLEIYTDHESAAAIMELASGFGIEAAVSGYCEKSDKPSLLIESPYGSFTYDKP